MTPSCNSCRLVSITVAELPAAKRVSTGDLRGPSLDTAWTAHRPLHPAAVADDGTHMVGCEAVPARPSSVPVAAAVSRAHWMKLPASGSSSARQTASGGPAAGRNADAAAACAAVTAAERTPIRDCGRRAPASQTKKFSFCARGMQGKVKFASGQPVQQRLTRTWRSRHEMKLPQLGVRYGSAAATGLKVAETTVTKAVMVAGRQMLLLADIVVLPDDPVWQGQSPFDQSSRLMVRPGNSTEPKYTAFRRTLSSMQPQGPLLMGSRANGNRAPLKPDTPERTSNALHAPAIMYSLNSVDFQQAFQCSTTHEGRVKRRGWTGAPASSFSAAAAFPSAEAHLSELVAVETD